MEGEAACIVGAVYDAALEPDRWAELGPRLCRLFDAMSFLLVQQKRADRQVEWMETNWPAALLDDYAGYFYQVDTWMERGLAQPAMTPMIGDDYCPDRDFIQREIYCDFARPAGIRHLLAEYTVLEDGSHFSIGLHHTPLGGAFDAAHAHQLGRLFPHLARSAQIRNGLAAADLRTAVGDSVLDALAMGVVVVRADGSVLLANRAAEAIAARRDGFTLQCSRRERAVGATAQADTQRLRRLIAAATAPREGLRAGASLRLPCASGGRGYALIVAPLPRTLRRLGGCAPLALILMTDLDRARVPCDAQLRAVFGLTAAEARLVAALAGGANRAEYASQAGLSVQTVRKQLATAFAKLDVSRESDLIRLALSLPR